MRVPSDADNPTFDQTFNVGFTQWLTSKAAERKEWARRRNAAAQTAARNQNQRAKEWADRKQAERDAKRKRKSDS